MKKKVCIIHKESTLDPRSFFKEGRSLKKAGYDTCIMSLYDKSETIEGIKLVSFNPPKYRLIRFLLTNYYIFMKAMKEKVDIYHFHDFDFVPWAVLLKIITRKKVIYDVHEAHPEWVFMKTYIPTNFLKKIVSRLVYMTERIGSLFFDAIITNDNFVLQDFKHKKKEVIYNFPILEFFKFSNNNIPYQSREFDVIFIGSLPPWHFIHMLETAEILKDNGYYVKWLLLPSKSSPREWILSQLNNRKLSEYFSVPKTVPFESVPKYLYNSRIGIITIPPFKKYLKNIPLKMFEYMGCSLPVIASDLPPSRQFVEGKGCAILVKHDPEAYANAIISLLDNPQKAEEMGKRGRKLVMEDYNWNTEEQKLLRLYTNLYDNGKK